MSRRLCRLQVTRRLLGAAMLMSFAAGLLPARGMAQGPVLELLMFEEPGCPWCRRWQAEVGVGYPHSAEGKRAPLRIVQMHSPLPAGIQLARPVRASPTFVLVADGREIGRITGYPGADFFWPMLAELLRKSDTASASPADAQKEAT